MVQFFINLDWKKKKTAFLSIITTFLLFPIFLHGSVTPVYAASEASPPTFGQGPINVRLYTDYLCPSCITMELKIEPLLSNLVKRNVITLTFIDAPFYQVSLMYARYFLYAMEEKNDIDTALMAKKVLYAAGVEKITDTAKLEEVLKMKGVRFKVFDVKPIFALFIDQFQSDRIEATPSCVIERNGRKEIFKGDKDVVAALQKLLK